MRQSIRLTQLDGKLPNLALMRLSAWHRAQGHEVHFFRTPYRQLGEPDYSVVYGSAIFDFTADRVARFLREFPEAIIGGTWNHKPGAPFKSPVVEDLVGDFEGADYSHWPDFTASLGFSQRGCRFNCAFCGVPTKEGKPRATADIAAIWRGDPWPKHIHLLDNDFFGVAKPVWKTRIAEIREGGFAVCFNQGINIRVISDEIAAELATVQYRSDRFVTPKGDPERRIYTAWDSLGDEALFMRGVDRLEAAGIRPSHLFVYMLVGFDPAETWATVFHRFNAMVARGIKPYPMIFGDRIRTLPLGGYNFAVGGRRLMDFQRWVNTGLYRRGVDFAGYDNATRRDPLFKLQSDLFEEEAA